MNRLKETTLKTRAINELSEKGRKGFLWLLLGTAGQNVLQIISLLVLARILSPEEFGVVGVGTAVITFLRIFAEIGVGPALVQKENITLLDIKTANTLSIAFGVALAGLLYTQSENLALFFETPQLQKVLQAMAFTLPLVSYSVVCQSLLQRKFEFKKLSGVTFISYFLAYGIISIYMALHGYGLWSLIAAFWVQSVSFFILTSLLCRDTFKIGFSLSSARSMLHFGMGHSMARLWNYAAGQGDNLIIGKILGAGALGLYGRAYQIMSMPAILFGSVIDKVFFPLMAKLASNQARLEKLYLSSIYFSLLIFIYLSGYVFIFSDQITYLLFGNGWSNVADLIEIMAIGLYFRIGYKFSDCLTMATGNVYTRATVQFIYAVSVLTFVTIGSKWGLTGAAVGVVSALILNYLIMTFMVWRILHFKLFMMAARHLKTFLIFLVGLALFKCIDHTVHIAQPLVSFLVSSCIYFFALGAVTLLCKPFLKEEFGVLMLIMGKRQAANPK